MRQAITLLILVCFSNISFSQKGNFQELSDKKLEPFPMPSGQIQYTISGDATGIATLLFSHFGWRQKMSTAYSYTQYGVEGKADKIEIRNGDMLYDIKVDKDMGTSNEDKSLSQLLAYKKRPEAWEAIMLSQGGTKSGTEKILDRDCDVWVFEKGLLKKLWLYEGVPLKSEKMIGKLSVITTALSIEEMELVAAKNFELEGVEWR